MAKLIASVFTPGRQAVWGFCRKIVKKLPWPPGFHGNGNKFSEILYWHRGQNHTLETETVLPLPVILVVRPFAKIVNV